MIDEINGHAVTAAMRGKLGGIMRQASGKPVLLSIIKVSFCGKHWHTAGVVTFYIFWESSALIPPNYN